MQNVTMPKNGFDRIAADIVGDHIRKGKAHDWYRAGEPIDMEASYAVIMTSMRMDHGHWEDNKIAELIADYNCGRASP